MPDGLSHSDAHVSIDVLSRAATGNNQQEGANVMANPNFHDTNTALVDGIVVSKVANIWVTTVRCRMSSGPNIGEVLQVVFNKHKWDTADAMVADILAALANVPNDVSIPDGVLGASI